MTFHGALVGSSRYRLGAAMSPGLRVWHPSSNRLHWDNFPVTTQPRWKQLNIAGYNLNILKWPTWLPLSSYLWKRIILTYLGDWMKRYEKTAAAMENHSTINWGWKQSENHVSTNHKQKYTFCGFAMAHWLNLGFRSHSPAIGNRAKW